MNEKLSINTKNAKNNVKNNKNTVKSAKNKEKLENEYFYSEEEDKVIVDFVNADFNERRSERKPYDLAWELNINFLLGNQFSYISDRGEVEKTPKQYYWQGEEVYNHISPIVETRLAKLSKVRPTFAVKPTGSESRDMYCAKLSKNILSVFASKNSLSDIISEATLWSEVCGTSFYKVTWNSEIGDTVGSESDKNIMLGDAEISVCSPFEIFPDSLGSVSIDKMQSIIHARPVPASFIKDNYGKVVTGSDIDTFTFEQGTSGLAFSGKSNALKVSKLVKHDHVLLIERYEKPSQNFPNGKLTIIASNVLLYDGDLPYINYNDNKRGFPFIRQICQQQIGSFFGTSVIERCIPVQRAFNLVKNRKHEFMARLASGVLAVEDGSVDIDLIEEEGIAPGKIIVYRNGATPPRFIDPGQVPNDFDSEEDRLLSEFNTISGVSELMRDSTVPSSVTSGVALSLLIEQDETRLSVSAEYIRSAVREIAENVIRLYKQFASTKRLLKVTDEHGEIETYYWNNSDISYEEIVLETINELNESPAQRKNMLFELYKSGLFAGDDGKVDKRVKNKIIQALGFNDYEVVEDLSSLHIKSACKENLSLSGEALEVSDVDDHDIHIQEHTKFILSDDKDNQSREHLEKILNHILEHKVMRYAGNVSENKNNL